MEGQGKGKERVYSKPGVAPEISGRGAGASGRGAKMTAKWCFHALFCQISSDENPKFPPMGGGGLDTSNGGL